MTNNQSLRGTKPNIILVLCDDLGYGDIACFGSNQNMTPTLDHLQITGAKLTDFHVVSPVCSPSRAGLMTGCYPQRVGLGRGDHFCVLLPGDPIGINPEETIIPKALKTAGYRTHMIGKWHLGDQAPFLPTKNGFDTFFGLPYSNDMCYYHPDLHVKFPPLPLMREDEIIGKDPSQGNLNELYVKEAVALIERQDNAPFFLYFAHMYVHWPFYPPHSFLKQSKGNRYRAEVEFIDWAMEQMIAALNRVDKRKNTLIVFTSDNGGVLRYGSNGQLRGQKGDVYEGGVRVPCIVNWPGKISEGIIIDNLLTTMDLLPTFAHLAGVSISNDKKIDGENVTNVLIGVGPKENRELIIYHDNILKAVRKGDWKLILNTKELFNLLDDPNEKNNQYSTNPDIVSDLMLLAQRYRNELGDGDKLGTSVRKPGRVDNPTTMFPLDEDSPLTAEYE